MFTQLEPQYFKNYRAGQIYFVWNMRSPVHKGISWFSYKDKGDTMELEKIAHCGICVDEGLGVGAHLRKGVYYEDLNELFSDPFVRIIFREPKMLDIKGSEDLTKDCIKDVGKFKYDVKLIIGLMIVNSWIGRKFSQNVKDWILKKCNAPTKYICSEYVMWKLLKNGFTTDDNISVTPAYVFGHSAMKPLKF